MNQAQGDTSAVVKAGMDRICADFTDLVTPLGFRRATARGRKWTHRGEKFTRTIHFHRSGSSYGAPINHSISIRVEFFVYGVEENLLPSAALTSDSLRDSRGHAYHLRFNALSWSTYDRCLEDLLRVTQEHGLPWFEKQGA
jgi:hypothetical protein